MFISWFLRLSAIHLVAKVLAYAIYIYLGVKDANLVLSLHDYVGQWVKMLRDMLPSEARLVFHLLKLESSIVVDLVALAVVLFIGIALSVRQFGKK